MRLKGVKEHAVMPPPSWIEIQAEADLRGCSVEEAAASLLRRRSAIMEAEVRDPLRCGWEPRVWKVADALLGLDCHDVGFLKMLERRLGLDWEGFCQGMRRRLGFEQPVVMLLVLGANRSSKSNYAAKRCQELASFNEKQNVFAFHMSEARSRNEQQHLFWHYMPPEWKVQEKGEETYIAYKRKTGFSDSSFITPNGSECIFLNYMQDRDTALQGTEPNLMLPDELVPPDWLDFIPLRLATRGGKAVVTFTPVQGYTPSVNYFCASGKVTRWSTGFMLPRDGGEPDPARALGLTEEEYKEVMAAQLEKRAAECPQSRPEDVLGWGEGGDTEARRGIYGEQRSQPRRSRERNS
jgi:hypothetical protein